MLGTIVRGANTTLKVLWLVSAISATTFGSLYGWQGYGWDGALGFGVVGFGVGSAIAVALAGMLTGMCLERLGNLCLGLLRLLWE